MQKTLPPIKSPANKNSVAAEESSAAIVGAGFRCCLAAAGSVLGGALGGALAGGLLGTQRCRLSLIGTVIDRLAIQKSDDLNRSFWQGSTKH